MLCLALPGCGGGSDDDSSDEPVFAEGSATAACSSAMGGPGVSPSRGTATASGRFAVYGTGRDFRKALKEPVANYGGLRERHVSGPIFGTKTPFVVEGRAPIEVAIAPEDRARAGLVAAPFGGGPYVEIRFVPCRDQPRTWWPAGWVLRDHGPVTVVIHEDGRPDSTLVAGRP